LLISSCIRTVDPKQTITAVPQRDTTEWIIHIPAFSRENARTAARVLFEFDSVGYVDSVETYETETLYEVQGFFID
jgi:hypothetical protein